ncbi:putative Fanconi anemia-associated protein of 24 kDa [Apostichopus japonicus]|uniref:Putative Fanconi anemia-associated protein of 24 kDa n=1 Tax=Stichopus japonicus TaxID=307972 RepID=A0A2G8LNX8_STIJA|nr:putative Fanconi anemia-associated protein of 24 kDa [Apostichopus japonicus]
MQGRVRIVFEGDTGVVDFHTAHDKAVIYVSEADLISGPAYRKKLAKLRKAKKLKGIVLVEKTPMTEQYFLDVQKFVVIELGFVLLPVTNQVEAGNLLVQMVNEENKPNGNPFIAKAKRGISQDQAVLSTVQMIPKLGSVKAKALLCRFKSIHGIQAATMHDLSDVVGRTNAQHVKAFFEEKRKVR